MDANSLETAAMVGSSPVLGVSVIIVKRSLDEVAGGISRGNDKLLIIKR